VKLGLQLNSFDWDDGPKRFASALAEIAQAAEEDATWLAAERVPRRAGTNGTRFARTCGGRDIRRTFDPILDPNRPQQRPTQTDTPR